MSHHPNDWNRALLNLAECNQSPRALRNAFDVLLHNLEDVPLPALRGTDWECEGEQRADDAVATPWLALISILHLCRFLTAWASYAVMTARVLTSGPLQRILWHLS